MPGGKTAACLPVEAKRKSNIEKVNQAFMGVHNTPSTQNIRQNDERIKQT
jgi:hypothetical protein